MVHGAIVATDLRDLEHNARILHGHMWMRDSIAGH
jgi:hypothetical protein